MSRDEHSSIRLQLDSQLTSTPCHALPYPLTACILTYVMWRQLYYQRERGGEREREKEEERERERNKKKKI